MIDNTEQPRFQVEWTRFAGDWENTWTVEDENGEDVPETYASIQEAEAALAKHFKDCDDESTWYNESECRIQRVRYEVQFLIGGQWQNCWRDEIDGEPCDMTFETKAEAVAHMEEARAFSKDSVPLIPSKEAPMRVGTVAYWPR